MSKLDFTLLRNNTNGLLSFNTFLSTSLRRDVAVAFARPSLGVPSMTTVLFTILIDSTMTSNGFASLSGQIHINNEEEVLFGFGSVFRIHEIKLMDSDFWEISMSLTRDNDPQLVQLTEYTKRTMREFSGVPRLAQLVTRMGAWDAAREIYEALLAITDKNNASEVAHIQNQLGYLAWQKNELDLALIHYGQSLSNRTNRRCSRVALTHRNIGLVLKEKGEYDKALAYYQDALSMDLAADPPNHEQIVCSKIFPEINLSLHVRRMGISRLEFFTTFKVILMKHKRIMSVHW